jgi:hypothetical protein
MTKFGGGPIRNYELERFSINNQKFVYMHLHSLRMRMFVMAWAVSRAAASVA